MVARVAVTARPGTSPPTTSVPNTTVTQPVYDPYEAWLASEGPTLLDVTRGDAMARAWLGCGTDWPVGTADFFLASAYRAVPGFCEQG